MDELRRELRVEGAAADVQAQTVNEILRRFAPGAGGDTEVALPARVLEGIRGRSPLGDVVPLPPSPASRRAIQSNRSVTRLAEMIATAANQPRLSCPMPIVKTALAVKPLARGALIEVLATDPGSQRDFVAWCRSTGHELIEQTADGSAYRFLIRRK